MEADEANFFERALLCGWRSFRPFFFQRLNTPKWFLVFLFLYSFMQGMIVTGLTAAGLFLLEKRFKLTSKQTGMIVAANDVSALILIIFISYFGGHRNKARWLGIGALVTSLGCLLFAFFFVLVGKYTPLELETFFCIQTCWFNSTKIPIFFGVCAEAKGYTAWNFFLVFVGAKLLLGAGFFSLFTLGPAYIDENVFLKAAPMYLGVWFIAFFFGPGIGYVAGGSLLNVWVDLIQPPGVDLTFFDPRWIGAWWLGYFFFCLLLLCTSIALLGFFLEMPGAREQRLAAIFFGLLPPRDEHIQGRFFYILPATKSILTNKIFLFNTCAFCCTTLIAFFLGPFVSKFIQSQFFFSSSTAGILSGFFIIPGTAGGIFLGSFFFKRVDVRRSCKMAVFFCFIFQFIGTWAVLTFLIPGCKTTLLAGIFFSYNNSTLVDFFKSSPCNNLCHCNSFFYDPVCGVDEVSYFFFFHAGCTKRIVKDGNFFMYFFCRCISSPDSTVRYFFSAQGTCDRDCKNLIPFLFGAVVLLIFNFIFFTPNKTVVLRCVPDNQRTYFFGLQWLFLSMFGSLFFSVIFGAFIDKTCIFFLETCSGRGSCLEYNNELLSYLLVAAGLFFQVLSTALYFGSWFFCKSHDPLIPGILVVGDSASSQTRLSPPQTPVPGFEFRQQRQAAGQQALPEGEALAQADHDRENSSPVPGFARYEADDDSVYLSFTNAGGESQSSFLPIAQIESSI
ncbi:solute carrier organic anion transporter family member 4A1-like [Stylophora pistillata]|uniref:solute carrier organic anion transporter family member 4A1-like n=1 Tax=Stylophora pistillata TaxID=50429 RepID=UPI000C04D48A|nr:solute carrier organic anion transporter family member 4A1-like [Stylophora pistillata]